MTFLLFVTASYAQEDGNRKADPAQRAARMQSALTKDIDVTETQKTALKEVFATYVKNMETYRTEGSNKEMMQAVNNKRDAAVREILNDDNKYGQYILALEEMKKKMQERREQNASGRHQGGGNGMGRKADNSTF